MRYLHLNNGALGGRKPKFTGSNFEVTKNSAREPARFAASPDSSRRSPKPMLGLTRSQMFKPA